MSVTPITPGTLVEPMAYMGRRVTITDSGSPKQHVVSAWQEGAAVLTDPTTHEVTGRVPLRRLTLVPEPVRTAHRPKGYLQMTGLTSTRDEATEWLAFLMMQASSVFENVPPAPATGDLPSANDTARTELERLLTARGHAPSGPTVTAALAYYDAAAAWYGEHGSDD